MLRTASCPTWWTWHATSDALVLCAAADKAEGIVDAAVLDALGPRGFLVNVARGRLINEADLSEASPPAASPARAWTFSSTSPAFRWRCASRTA